MSSISNMDRFDESHLLTVTCIQAEITPGDPGENTQCAQTWLEKCTKTRGHPHFTLFPEYFLQGLTEDGATLAQSLDGAFGQAMLASARKHGAYIFAGFLETSPDPKRPYNSIGIWGPSGIVGAYRKAHLYDWGEPHPDWVREAKAFLPGDRLGFFEMERVRVGVMTCADGLVVEVPRTLAVMGVDLILYPNGRNSVLPEQAEYHVAASGVPIAVCNGWGSVGPETMHGGSRMIDLTTSAVRASATGPDMISATFDINSLRKQRRTHWPLCGRRPELYQPMLCSAAEMAENG